MLAHCSLLYCAITVCEWEAIEGAIYGFEKEEEALIEIHIMIRCKDRR